MPILSHSWKINKQFQKQILVGYSIAVYKNKGVSGLFLKETSLNLYYDVKPGFIIPGDVTGQSLRSIDLVLLSWVM